MASTIITECAAKVNIADVVFEAVEQSLPDNTDDLNEIMLRGRAIIGWELFRDLEFTVNMTIGQAMEDGFHIGWQMRGKV